jgi:hypothetical protein
MIWRATDRRSELLGLGLATVFASYFVLYGLAILLRDEPFPFGDFIAIWADARLLATHKAADLYNPAVLPGWQHALGLPGPGSTPFPYPPAFLPVIRPLGLLAYNPAFAVFAVVSLASYLASMALPRPKLPLVLVALAAPTTILTLIAGQSGLLAAGLFLGGLRAAPVRPVFGGVLLGLLAFKPQLGLLVPVALVAAGAWRCIAAAAITVVLVALATSAGFGWHIWADWLAYLPTFSAQFERESSEIEYLMPTLTGTLRLLGAAPSVARPPQIVLAIAAAVWVWRACRGGLGPRAVLVLATATFLATPYAFIYDLPLLTGAVLLFVASRAHTGLSTRLLGALVLALLFPVVLVHAGAVLPVGCACLLLLAAALVAAAPA